MGTDIHMSAEVRNSETGAWEFLPGPVIECWSCDGTGFATRWEERKRVPWINDDGTRKPCGWCTNDGMTPEYEGDTGEYYRERYVEPGKTRDHWYSDRNYVMFAILGNVRNGSGFAGVETFVPLPSISDGRGIPDDATPETLQILSDEHSGTWCTLDEVDAYDWDQDIQQSGIIGLDVYAQLREGNKSPDSWSGGISGQGIVTVTMQAADALLAQQPAAALTAGGDGGALKSDANIRGGAPADMLFGGGGMNIGGTRYYVKYRWVEKLDESTAGFRKRMELLHAAVGDRECRLVYDFDS